MEVYMDEIQLGGISAVPATDEFARWCAPQENEVSVDALAVEGQVPEWLTGTLVRNGPAHWGTGPRAARHLLDGLAMLHKFAFTEGRVSYANRFLRTKAYQSLREDGRIGYREFASDPCRKLTQPIATLFDPRYTDNASVNVIRLGDRLVALTETPLPVAFDPETLETLGVAYDPPGRGVFSPTGHPHFDRAGSMISTQVHFGLRSSYRVYRQTPTGFRQVAKVPVARPSYLHSFALTERHIVVVESPFRVNPLELAAGRKPFIQNYRWRPDQPTTFLVLDRHTGELKGRWESEAMFFFHTVNAYDDPGGEIVVDLCGYSDPSLIDSLYLDALSVRGTPIPTATFHRYRLGASGRTRRETPSQEAFEWPGINYGADNARPYRYAYGSGAVETGAGPVTTITKLDVTDGTTAHWHQPGCLTGEPVFVPAPGRGAEDAGVVLAVVFEPERDASFLLVLDARDLGELARAHAPHRMPFGFHGNFFPDPAPGESAVAS
ncbi:carotenoid oxygenase family protein [Streptomyces sp. DSM 44917]|uniref:Dioxygenase n=1 Tax=Streptomyces boetiae TaxID=3075541 RepID=A0ABU2LFW3_9ACTN|nr:carotenoid oxygenase family protein [Streptomyces sp. DSM 44917]MDT0310132.1 carotenoid oxygenase family protein [Streptomyces sp. DSM 44917]